MAVQFTLKDQSGSDVERTQFTRDYVLLSFHPLAWTSVCEKQMLSLENNYHQFREIRVVPLGISVDAVPTKKAWAKHMNLNNLSILSDFWPHGALADMLGLFLEDRGTSARANVLLDLEGEIVFSQTCEISKIPDVEDLLHRIKKELG